MVRLIGLALLLCLAGPAFAIPPAEVGMVLIHGKSGSPPGPLAPYFEHEGFKVFSPNLPWSRSREYDETYASVLAKLHDEVLRLREQGARFVIVGGLSFGANAALAYQAEYGDADALMLFSPGHAPLHWYERGITRKDVDQANELLKQGKGDERVTFDDFNTGNTVLRRSSTASIYLSYFNPKGRAVMSLSAQAIKKPVPVLLVNSREEMRSQGRGFIFARLPEHPQSVFMELPVEHAQTPRAARDEARRFVKTVTGD